MIFLLFGLLYDIVNSLLIALLPNHKEPQSAIFLVMEITYLVILLIFNPFVDSLLMIMMMIQRILFLLQGVVMVISLFSDNGSSFNTFLQLLFLIFSWSHLVIGLFTVIIALLDFMKQGKEENRKSNYRTKDIRNKDKTGQKKVLGEGDIDDEEMEEDGHKISFPQPMRKGMSKNSRLGQPEREAG